MKEVVEHAKAAGEKGMLGQGKGGGREGRGKVLGTTCSLTEVKP